MGRLERKRRKKIEGRKEWKTQKKEKWGKWEGGGKRRKITEKEDWWIILIIKLSKKKG